MAEPITLSLMEISMIMSDGVKFVHMRTNFEKWAKEAEQGNKDSKTLVDLVYQFERLVKVASEA